MIAPAEADRKAEAVRRLQERCGELVERYGPAQRRLGDTPTNTPTNTPGTRHPATEECDGTPMITGFRCVECGQRLCPCEYGYGHDCEG